MDRATVTCRSLSSASDADEGVWRASASPNRRAGDDRRASRRLRLDDQLATDQLQTFLHAGEAEPRASVRCLDVEADSLITNRELDGVAGSAKMDLEMPGAAVAHRIVHGLLEDPEQTKRQVRGDIFRDVLAAEIDPGAFLARELATEAPHRGHHAQMEQPWRMQLVRQRLHIRDDLCGLLLKIVEAA